MTNALTIPAASTVAGNNFKTMPLYAELQVGTERIIYPMPVPQNKEHCKVVRVLEGSTLYDRKYPKQPLHLFNGDLLWATETTIKQAFDDLRNKLLEAAEKAPEQKRQVIHNALAVADAVTKSADVIKAHAENPDGNLFDKIGEVLESSGLINPLKAKSGNRVSDSPLVENVEYVIKTNPFAISAPKIVRSIESPYLNEETSDPETCKHRRTDYFIGTGIVCRDCKKKLRV